MRSARTQGESLSQEVGSIVPSEWPPTAGSRPQGSEKRGGLGQEGWLSPSSFAPNAPSPGSCRWRSCSEAALGHRPFPGEASPLEGREKGGVRAPRLSNGSGMAPPWVRLPQPNRGLQGPKRQHDVMREHQTKSKEVWVAARGKPQLAMCL